MTKKSYFWTKEKDNLLAQLYNSGKSMEKIFPYFSTDKRRVIARINVLKLKRPKLKTHRGIVCPREQAIYTCAIENPGCDVADIEKKTGINKAQIRATLRRNPVLGIKDRGLEQSALAHQSPIKKTVGIVNILG